MEIKTARETGYYVENFQGEITLHSPVNPHREAREQLPEEIRSKTRPILFGAGLGYRLTELVELCSPPRALVFEPFPELLERGKELEIWDPDNYEQLTVIKPETSQLLGRLEKFLPLESYNQWTLVDWPEYRQLAPDFFKRMQIQLQGLNRYHEINLLTLRNKGKQWLNQTRESLPLIPRATTPVPESFQGPFAVVGAGPSLDEQLGWLRKNQERLNVAAINTAGPILAKAGIEVDLHFAADADATVYEDLKNSRLKHLLVSPAVDPQIIRQLEVPFTLLVLTSPFTDWMFSAPFLARGAASSAASPTLVKWLLEKPVEGIYLLGMDLEGHKGRYYARGTHREELALKKLNRFFTLPEWHQQRIKREYSGRHSQLEAQQQWLEFLSQQVDGLRAVEPVPAWWAGEPAPSRIEQSRSELQFERPKKEAVKEWLQEQYKYFRALRTGGRSNRAWQRFLVWLKELQTDWEAEYERWRATFKETMRSLE